MSAEIRRRQINANSDSDWTTVSIPAPYQLAGARTKIGALPYLIIQVDITGSNPVRYELARILEPFLAPKTRWTPPDLSLDCS